MNSVIRAEDINKIYKTAGKELAVLKGVSLSVAKGEFVAIVGPSGAGKSTLLHVLSGLDMPSKGKVVFKNDDIYDLSDNKLAQIRNEKFGFVFQFYHLLAEFNVLENVLMPARILKNEDQLKAKGVDLLQQLGLDQRMEHFPNQLSGGERQRVALARALINSPEVLFCDEPTGNLDSQAGEQIFSLIRKINQEEEMTVVLVTHNMELAKSSQKTYKLKDGVLVN